MVYGYMVYGDMGYGEMGDMGYGYMVYGLWVYGIWYMVYGIWYMVYGMVIVISIMKDCITLACLAILLNIASSVMAQQREELLQQTDSLYTIFTVYYPDQHLTTHDQLFLRGDACNLTWDKGHLLTRNAKNEWQLSLLCPQNKSISVKALLNDSSWSFGQNTVFNGERSVKLYPCFKPSANPIKDK